MSNSKSVSCDDGINYEAENIEDKREFNSLKENNIIGPALPPELTERKKDMIGPALPPHLTKENPEPAKSSFVGPALPPHMLGKTELSKCEKSEPSPTVLGPQLPPHLLNKMNPSAKNQDNERTVGPSLPPHLRQQLKKQPEDAIVDSDEDEAYGPLPVGLAKYSATEVALEERALQLQIDKLTPSGNKEPARESWMIDLPEAKAAHFGLGPRQFRNRAAPDMSDRSSWTDIPGEKSNQKNKEKKVDLKVEAEEKEMKKRDKEQERLAKRHKRKSKSLVEMHQEKMKKEENTLSVERRPFSREIDLQVNKFDDAQKKAILKKAQLLDDRFSAGKSKFL